MPRDEDDDDSLPPLGENTDKFLDQAKKGQARNFLLVCKGNKVKYLAVRKKPIKKNELNEAKKAGYKGDGYFGVITGKGMELVFNLSTADGYTSEPVKEKVLKDFLEEKAGFKSKPTIAIVATLPEVPFDDEDLKNPLIARFLGLGEKISQVLDVNPGAEAELKQTTSEIRALLQEADFGAAEPRIATLESRLVVLLGGGSPAAPAVSPAATPATPATPVPPPPPPPQQAPAPAPGGPNASDAFKERLAALIPKIKAAAGTPAGDQAKLLASEAGVFARKQEFEQANALIEKAEQLLKAPAGAAPVTPAATDNNLTDQLKARLTALVPVVKAFVATLDPASETKNQILTMLRDANGMMGKDNAQVEALLSQVNNMMGAQSASVAPGDESTSIDWAEAKRIWQDASDLVDSQIAKLQSVLKSSGDSELVEIAEFGLNAVTGNFKVRLMAALMDIDRNTGDARSKAAKQVQDIIKQFRSHLDSDAVEAVDSNPFGVQVTVESTLSDAFDSMEKVLSAMVA